MTPQRAPVDREALLDRLHVVSIPLRVRFRGITTREVALLEGPAGWGEFGPFLDYAPTEASRWLAAAIESAYAAWPAPVRPSVPVNATVPALRPEAVPAVLARFPAARRPRSRSPRRVSRSRTTSTGSRPSATPWARAAG
jgi:O-succinylbenzoate synthase